MEALKYNVGGCYIREIDRMVYPGRVVDEFDRQIEALDSWSGEQQLVEFEQQGLFFEARVVKTGSEVCVVCLYANTPKLDVLSDLEDELMYRLEQRLGLLEEERRATMVQMRNIRDDESFVRKPIA